MKRAIITGANGFLGKNLTKELYNRGYQITALVRKIDNELQTMANCICVKDLSMDTIESMLSGQQYDCFYDFAWSGTSGKLRADFNVQLDNVRLTCDYVKLAAMIKCPRFVYASSINEMETYEYLQQNNAEPSGGYIYGISKLSAHLMGETVAYQSGIEFIPVIITNIYGAGEKSARLIYTSIVKLLKGEHCSFTEGYQMYDFIYITDAINAVIEVAEKGKAFNRYYVGSGEPKPLREFLLKMRDIVNPNAILGLGDIPFKGANIDYNQFDMKNVEKDTGYKNKVSFEEGIKKTRDWIKTDSFERHIDYTLKNYGTTI